MAIQLAEHQLEAIKQLKRGSILCGTVGSGKSRTALAYYYLNICKGGLCINGEGEWAPMKEPSDIYIITTAKKRDSKDWEKEMVPFLIEDSMVHVDSWNNIKKYADVYDAFFIFDEQRVVGSGTWVKAFLNITRKNNWILLSATPGDTWMDYIPVFIANGFYKNKTQFLKRHVIFSRYTKYPKVDGYREQGLLMKLKNDILVIMADQRHTVHVDHVVEADYSKAIYKTVWKDRWNPYTNEPIPEQGALFYILRRVVNSDPDRILKLIDILECNPKVIIFYNFDYELEMLRDLCTDMGIPFSEWNGHKHDDILDGDQWVYLVQYVAGAEGWNCTTTNVIVFYSQHYSYKITEQSRGRIDRMNTPFKELHYYYLRSKAPIDIAITRALNNKKTFNESNFLSRQKHAI